MLTPPSMLFIKNRAGKRFIAGGRAPQSLFSSFNSHFFRLVAVVSAAGLLAGCTPAGPRALLAGKRLMDHGKYPQAVEKLRVATSLLTTNAQAWNYLGLACQHMGQTAEAEKAYQRALALDHDLSEAHYNLGCLWLAQNKPEAAKTELMAFTLRRGNSPEGLLQLGAAQLRLAEVETAAQGRLRELAAAEKSFTDLLRLSPQNVAGLNGLGLARLHRGRAGEAAQLFNSALKQQPDYPPALLNLAIVSHQYLKDRPYALQKYREYLALKPAPENLEAVIAIARQLEQELNPPARSPATNLISQINTNVNPPKSPTTNLVRIAAVPKPEISTNHSRTGAVASVSKPAPATNAPKQVAVTTSLPPQNVEVVSLASEPVFKVAQDVSPAPAPAEIREPLNTTASPPAHAGEVKGAQRGFFQRVNPLNLFHNDGRTAPRPTPLSASSLSEAEPKMSSELERSSAESPAKTGSARYTYKSPAKPAPGNRAEAERFFSQGVQAQQAHRLPEAMVAYGTATQKDPSYFDAYYNLGLAANEAGNLPAALRAYEMALAVRPESLDARYNFALGLKQGNYLVDAEQELGTLLARYPKEARANLALGNIYAQDLHQPAKAREHYLKVLEADPRHPQAGAIRYWLTDNPL